MFLHVIMLCLLVTAGGDKHSNVANFISEILSKTLPKCSLVLVHDYATLPESFRTLLSNSSLEYHFSMVFRASDEFKPPSHKNVRDLWDFFERQKKAGPCVLHVLTSSTLAAFKRMSIFHALSIKVEAFRDHFVLWVREESSQKALLMDVTEGWAFKVGITTVDRSGRFDVHTVCFYCDHGKKQLRYLGRYPDLLEVSSVRKLYPDMTRNLHGKHIRVPYFLEVTSAQLDKKIASKGFLSLDAPEMAFHFMGTQFNYTWETYLYDLHPMEILRSRMDNGTWLGVVGEVISGRADVAPVSLYHSEAMGHMNYPFPYVYTWFTYVTGRAKPVWSWKTIFWPYQPLVWLLIITGTMLAVVAAWILLKVEPMHITSVQFKSFCGTAAYCVRAFFEQLPNQEVPTADGFRVFITFWVYFAMVITCGYQEMIFGFVAVPIRETIPDTFLDLLSSGYEIGAHSYNGIAYAVVVEEADLPVHRAIKEKLILYSSFEKCLQRSLDIKAACFGFHIMLDVEMWKIVNSKGVLPFWNQAEAGLSVYTGVACPKDEVSFTGVHDSTIRGFEGGLGIMWKKNMVQQNFMAALKFSRRKCSVDTEEISEDEEERKPLTMKKLYGPFWLVVFGWIISIVGFGLELVGIKSHVNQ